MLEDVLTRIEERLEAVGLSATAASKKAGLSDDAIRNLRRAVDSGDTRRGVSTNTITALAEVLETSAAYLLNGTVAGVIPVKTTVPLAGRIVAGGAIDISTNQEEPGMEYEIQISINVPDGVTAYQVVGESMMPVYRPDTIIICRAHTTDIEQHIPKDRGRELAVGTHEHGRMLKIVHRGSSPGLYHLESFNATFMRDVKLEWIARIAATIPADEWELISRERQLQNAKMERLSKPSKQKRKPSA